MDSFLDSTDAAFSGMKRKFIENMSNQAGDVTIRHNLLSEFDEAERVAKSSRLSERSGKKPFTFSLSPTQTIQSCKCFFIHLSYNCS